MATHGFAGLFVKLKDKSVSLDDRLKLLRFAWKSSDVFIPNKEQALIDLLGTCLLDQKTEQLTQDDVSKVWQCLHEVLHTRRVQAARGQGKELVVKQSLAQLMTTYLANDDDKGTQPSLRSLVVGCCQAVVTSPMLAHVFTDRLDIMLSVICNLVRLGGEKGPEDTQLLLSTLVEKFLKSLRTAPNQNKMLQTMCDQLLPALVPQWSESSSASVDTAGQVFLAAFTHRDQRHGLNLYLESDPASQDEKLKKRGKMASHVFATFDKILNTQNAEKMVDFLCEVFNSYICHNCHEGSLQNSFNLLVHLCHLIGWRRDSAAPCRTTVAPPARLRGVQRLLTVVHDQELYNVGADEGAKQLSFYRCLVKIMLQIDIVCPDWFSILTLLLQLNHQIVEPSLTEVLAIGWLGGSEKMSGECVSSLDMLLEELVSTYTKLRQLPKLVNKLLQCLCSSNHGDRPVPMTTKFFKCFGDTTQTLPQGTMVDIWKTFIGKMKETFIEGDAKKADTGTGHLQGTVCLLHQFLMNLRVVDYTVTEATSRAVQDLMVTMETDILTPLLKMQLDKEEVQRNLPDTLHLCYSWGEVMILLAQYKQYRASQLKACTVVSHSHDLSFVHSYFSADQWRSLYKKVCKANNSAVQHVWDMLLVQKARTILLLKEASDWPVAADTLNALLVFPEKLEENVAMATWSKSVWEVTKENEVVARWHLLMTYLGAMQCVLTKEQLGNIAAWVARTHRSDPQTQKESGMTVAHVTQEFLQSAWVKENSGLQAQLVTQLLTTCRDCLTSNIQKPKKRKSGTGAVLVQKLYNILTSQEIDWAHSSNSEVQERLQGTGKCLGAVLTDKEAWTSLPGLTTLTSCLQVLESLPLEEMESCDQIRCLSGLLSLLAVLNRCSNQSEEENSTRQCVIEKCVALCTVLLESCSPAQLFCVIDIQTYLSWLCQLPLYQTDNKMDDADFHKHVLLTRVSCESIMRLKDAEKLEKLAPWISQTFSNLASSPQGEMEGKLVLMSSLLQSVAKVLTRAYLRDHLRPACMSIYTSLVEILLQLSPLLDDANLQRGGDHRVALLVYCYASVVEMYFGQEEVKGAFMEKFTQMLAWCEQVLTHRMSSASLFEKMSALNFLYSISKFYTGLDSVYTQAVRLDTWLMLVNVLQNMLINQSQTSSQLQQHNSQSLTGSHTQQQNSQSNSKPGLNHSYKIEADQSQLTEDKEAHKIKTDSDSNNNKSEIDDKISRIHTLLQGKTVVQEKEIGKKLQQFLKSQKGVNGDSEGHEGVMPYSAVVQWYGCMVFEGRLGDREGRLLMSLTQTVMAALLACLEVEQFDRIVSRLVDNVHSSKLLTETTTMRSSLYTWRQLLQLEFFKEQTDILKKSAKLMMLNLQSILQQLHHRGDETVVMEIVVPVLHTQQQIIAQKLLRSQLYLLCLHSCAYAPLGGTTYFPVFHSVSNVLDTLLVHHENTVFQSIPAYIACAKRLLLSVVDQSDQERVSHDPDVVESLKGCAYQMERLFTLIASHKVEFGKVATYVVADYVSAIQQVTLVPVVKRALVPAVYQMLDLCDTHAVAQLHTVLSHGVIDIFKALYHEYTKFHKYMGKV